jgi:large subunit ribosomal protein L4
MRRALSRSYHSTPTSSFIKSIPLCSKDDVPPPPPPSPPPQTKDESLSIDETEEQTTTSNHATNESNDSHTILTQSTLPPNLRLSDPMILKPATPLDLSGANRGQPELLNHTFTDTSKPPSLKLPVQNFNSSDSTESVELDPSVFAQPVRRDLVHRVVKWQLAKRRQGTHRQKNISEVSGSGRKPWQQKGTGRARAGHRRPPHWRGGARAFPKRPRDYSYKLQKRVRNQGLRSALSAKVLEGAIHIVDGDTIDTHKTAPLVSWLSEREIDSAVIVDSDDGMNSLLEMAVGNIPNVQLVPQRGANVYDIVRRRDLIL